MLLPRIFHVDIVWFYVSIVFIVLIMLLFYYLTLSVILLLSPLDQLESE